MFPPYIWHFTARAIEPTDAIYFSGPALREYCEKVHSLGYELFKRMSMVMMKRLQSARGKMLFARAGGTPHQPASARSPEDDPKSLDVLIPRRFFTSRAIRVS